MSETRHTPTPGPWRWEVNLKSKEVQLRGGGSLTVMDFVRYGMSGAAPRFRTPDVLMERAEAFASVVPGREHHAHWFQAIDHPDALLIAATPETAAERDRLMESNRALLAALHAASHALRSYQYGNGETALAASVATACDEAIEEAGKG